VSHGKTRQRYRCKTCGKTFSAQAGTMFGGLRKKLHLYIPSDLGYILACKLIAGRPEKDLADIEALCRTLGIQNRAQAQQVVNRYFPSPIHQATYLLPRTLDGIFGK
jgi:hypothetical protein